MSSIRILHLAFFLAWALPAHGYEIRGRVLHRGLPVRAVTITLLEGGNAVAEARSDEEGRFLLRSRETRIQLRYGREGYFPRISTIFNFGGRDLDHRVALKKRIPWSLTVRVRDPGGRGLPGIRVRVLRGADEPLEGWTQDQGQIDLGPLVDDETFLHITGEGFRGRRIWKANRGQEDLTLDVHLSPRLDFQID